MRSAHRLFTDVGYAEAGLERIAEEAGFSKGAIYSNFASKEELLFELVGAEIDARIDALSRALENDDSLSTAAAPLTELARTAGRELGGIGRADPGWQQLFIEFWLRCQANDALRTKLAHKRRAMRARIADAFRVQAARFGTDLDPEEALTLATATLALSNGLGLEFLIDPEVATPQLFGELLARLIQAAPQPDRSNPAPHEAGSTDQ